MNTFFYVRTLSTHVHDYFMRSVGDLVKGIGKRIGNGKFTSILDLNWAGGRKMWFKEGVIGSQDQKPRWVSELMTENNSWYSSLLHKWFELDDVKTIQIVHISRG